MLARRRVKDVAVKHVESVISVHLICCQGTANRRIFLTWKEAEKALNSLIFLTVTLMLTVSKTEGQVIKPS
jgi:hypothetical protein